MMTTPPATMKREAQESRRIRRAVRARLTDSERAGGPDPLAGSAVTVLATYWTLFSSSLAMEAGIGK